MCNVTDEELVLLYQQGQKDVFNQIYLRYKYKIRACAHKKSILSGGDIEDLCQEGGLGLVNAANNYKSDQGCSFSTFSFTCIENAMKTALKSANSTKNQPLNNSISITETNPDSFKEVHDPESEIISKEAEEELLLKINKGLSSFEVKVLSMYLAGLSYTEIGEKLKKTSKSIDNALQRIRHKTSELLAKRRK